MSDTTTNASDPQAPPTHSSSENQSAYPRIWMGILFALVAIAITALWLGVYNWLYTAIWLNSFVTSHRWTTPVLVLFFSLLVGLAQKYLRAPNDDAWRGYGVHERGNAVEGQFSLAHGVCHVIWRRVRFRRGGILHDLRPGRHVLSGAKPLRTHHWPVLAAGPVDSGRTSTDRLDRGDCECLTCRRD